MTKRILITGKNSYIGNSVENWLNKQEESYHINSIDMKDGSWKDHDFSQYDVIFHVAGIAHVSTDPNMEDLYYKVNRDLTIETAQKAKDEGVKQFIFMSSIIVYGNSDIKDGVITKDTIPVPSNFYGKSKLEAEEGISKLESDNFRVAIIRPPMIYGKGSKGNYPRLAKLARITPIFPDYPNQRSMLYVDNLSEFIKILIDTEETGLFFPQNEEYVSSTELVKHISFAREKKIYTTKVFNPIIKMLKKFAIINKVFGNLTYEKKLSMLSNVDYQLFGLQESIKITEAEDEDYMDN